METKFPVAPEPMQAFPIGALAALLAVVSTIAAQHGAEHARQVCRELAASDELWEFIASRLARSQQTKDEGFGDTARTRPPEASVQSDVELELEREGTTVVAQPVTVPRRSKAKRRRDQKPNGASE